MPISEIKTVRDYNRGLLAPIRWAHIAWAAALWATRDLRVWATHPDRRAWAVPMVWCLVVAVLVYPLDRGIASFFRAHRLGGDVRRELEAAQQYGQMVSSLLIALVIWLQDPAVRRRLVDWVAAFAVAGIACNAIKMLVGRPRPLLEDAYTFLGPLGEYPINKDVGIHHAWEFWSKNAADIWSMPSSHTAYACLMAVMIASLYPRLRVLAGSLAALVAFARVATGAHYPSDVAVGAAIGLSIARTAVAGSWGETLLRLFTRSQVNAQPGDLSSEERPVVRVQTATPATLAKDNPSQAGGGRAGPPLAVVTRSAAIIATESAGAAATPIATTPPSPPPSQPG